MCVTMAIALRNKYPQIIHVAQRKVPGILDRSQKTHFFQARFRGFRVFMCYDGYCIAQQTKSNNTNIATESARNSRPIPEDTLFLKPDSAEIVFFVCYDGYCIAHKQTTDNIQIMRGKCPEFSTDPRRHTFDPPQRGTPPL